ncbi:hypothetical protein HPB47_009786, partial [Ixodes persulcatus]
PSDILIQVAGAEVPKVEQIRILGLVLQSHGRNGETLKRLESHVMQTLSLIRRPLGPQLVSRDVEDGEDDALVLGMLPTAPLPDPLHRQPEPVMHGLEFLSYRLPTSCAIIPVAPAFLHGIWSLLLT